MMIAAAKCHSISLFELAEEVGSNRKILLTRLKMARSVLKDEYKCKFKKGTKFDFERKMLISDCRQYALLWENKGRNSIGSVTLIKLL